MPGRDNFTLGSGYPSTAAFELKARTSTYFQVQQKSLWKVGTQQLMISKDTAEL